MKNNYPKDMNVLIIDEDWEIPGPGKGQAIDLLLVHKSRWDDIKDSEVGKAVLASVYYHGRLIIYNEEIKL